MNHYRYRAEFIMPASMICTSLVVAGVGEEVKRGETVRTCVTRRMLKRGLIEETD